MASEVTDIEEAKRAPPTPEKKEEEKEEKADELAETPPAARRGRPPGAKDKAPRKRPRAARGGRALPNALRRECGSWKNTSRPRKRRRRPRLALSATKSGLPIASVKLTHTPPRVDCLSPASS